MGMMKKAGDALYKVECFISGAAFVVMVGVIAFNVFCRFITRSSYAWAEEIAYLGFNWAVFFGICVVYRNQGLISIDVLVDRLPKGAARGAVNNLRPRGGGQHRADSVGNAAGRLELCKKNARAAHSLFLDVHRNPDCVLYPDDLLVLQLLSFRARPRRAERVAGRALLRDWEE